ncbi:MAG: LptF/LptG family permease [Pelagibacteraceae bacterium]
MNSVLNKYIIINFLKIVMNVTFIFIALGIMLNLFEEIEFFKDMNVGLSLPVSLTMMFIPNLIIMKLIPFIIFIASMWYLLSIRSSMDLLSLKIFGYSNIKIIFILSFTAFIFGIVLLLTVNPLTSSMVKIYETTKAKYSKDIDHLVSINKNGVWIKEKQNGNLRIITSKVLEKNFLYNVTIYNLQNNGKMINRIESQKANILDNNWQLQDVVIFDFGSNTSLSKFDNYEIISNYNSEKLNSLYRNLDTISFLDLVGDYEILLKRGYSEELLKERLNIFISMPIFLFLMVVLAAIFTIGSLKKSQNFYYIFISIISCVVIYYFKDLSIALGQTDRISLTLSVWMPIIAIGLFCSIGVIQINEK